MKNFKAAALAAGALVFGGGAASAQLIINEIMQSNIDCIMDDLNEFPDSWVELYNAGSETEHLQEYSILDKNKPEKAYQLPAVDVAPGAYVIVYCDKVGEGMHADFRLDSGKGGNIYLFHNGEAADQIENWKKQPAPNIAYGRKTDGDDKWGYMAVPTPGEANCGEVCKDVLGEPLFSVEGKVTNTTINLSLSVPDDAPEGTVVRYTVDGTEPTATSNKYTSPILINSTKVVRAKLLCDGYLSPRSTTHSYIHHPRAMALPIVSIVTKDEYFYGDKLGIYVQGNYTPGTANYQYDWRRPINFEYFEAENTPSSINQLCETRVKGGATRTNALKSLAVYANKRFGVKRFTYEFFPDQTPGINDFKSFEMRNSGNDFDASYMRDCIMQQASGLNVDLDWQPSRPAILYINGEYKGMLNIRPRSNEDYIYSFYDGLEDVDVIENWWELKEGSMDNLNAFLEYMNGHDHSLADYDQLMDVNEYLNYMLTNIYFDNKDFPGNNLVLWRPTAEGGRWRWICKDTDFGMGLYGERYDYPTLTWLTNPGYDNNKNDWANTYDATRLFRRLLEIQEFKDMFIDRAAIYLGDFLRPEKVISLIDTRYDLIKDEYKYHRDLINPWWPNHGNEVNNLRTWNQNRWSYFYDHVQQYFDLGAVYELTIDKGQATGRTLVVNGVTLSGDEFDGKFFRGRALTVQSLSDNEDYYVSGWEVKTTYGKSSQTATYDTETLSITPNSGTKIEIKAIIAEKPIDGISDAATDIDLTQPCDVYDLAGRYVGSCKPNALRPVAAPGIYILRQGSAARKTTVQ